MLGTVIIAYCLFTDFVSLELFVVIEFITTMTESIHGTEHDKTY